MGIVDVTVAKHLEHVLNYVSGEISDVSVRKIEYIEDEIENLKDAIFDVMDRLAVMTGSNDDE